MHRRFARTGSYFEGELEQGAVKGQLRCHGDDATPEAARKAKRTAACALGACACARGRKKAVGSGPTRPRRARELGVGFAPLAPCCKPKSEAGLRISAWPQLAGASDGAGASGIDSKLGPVPTWQAIAHDLDPPRIGKGGREIHVSAGDPCPSLLADPGDCSLEREGACRSWHRLLDGHPAGQAVHGMHRLEEELSELSDGEMHLDRALVTGTGGVPLPAAEAVAGLGSSFLGRWARGLGGILGGNVATLRREVGGGLCCSRTDLAHAQFCTQKKRSCLTDLTVWKAYVGVVGLKTV